MDSYSIYPFCLAPSTEHSYSEARICRRCVRTAPLYRQAATIVWIHCCSSTLLIDAWVVCSLGLLQIILLWTTAPFLMDTCFHFSWGNSWECIADSYDRCVFNILRHRQTAYQNGCNNFSFLISIVWRLRFFQTLVNTWYDQSFKF